MPKREDSDTQAAGVFDGRSRPDRRRVDRQLPDSRAGLRRDRSPARMCERRRRALPDTATAPLRSSDLSVLLPSGDGAAVNAHRVDGEERPGRRREGARLEVPEIVVTSRTESTRSGWLGGSRCGLDGPHSGQRARTGSPTPGSTKTSPSSVVRSPTPAARACRASIPVPR